MGFFVAALLRMTSEYTVSGWEPSKVKGKREVKTELARERDYG
jgi:hypothetical protein